MQIAEAKVDLSPMIDLVFLLLIFFMVASTAITYKKDKRVNIPVALDSEMPKDVGNRFILNVLKDGSLFDENGDSMTLEKITAHMREKVAVIPHYRLHVRADAGVAHEKVREVIDASAKGGVADAIFSTYNREQD